MQSVTSDSLRPEVTKTSSMYPTKLGIGLFDPVREALSDLKIKVVR